MASGNRDSAEGSLPPLAFFRNLSGKPAEFFRFCVAGGACFLVDYGLLFALTEFGGIPYLWSAACSFVAGVSMNYVLCIRYVYRNISPSSSPAQKAMFFAVSFVGLLLNQACMYALANICGLHYMLAKICATAVVTAWNYVSKGKALGG